MRIVWIGMLASSALWGCVFGTPHFSNESLRQDLIKRASFDLECPSDQLVLTELSRNQFDHVNSYGVQGCGKKVVYVRQKDNTNWVLNSK